ncbi:MAG: hypothetical protein IKW37_06945 [Bacteroidaceae bacterium]|nr:hypothetical protein [Bacteroidaceae bacterium]
MSEASSFCLVQKSAGVGKKVQTANFLCFVSFVRAKEMKSPRGLSESKATKPLRQLSKKHSAAKSLLRRLSKNHCAAKSPLRRLSKKALSGN